MVARRGVGGGGEERRVERAAEALGGVLGLAERRPHDLEPAPQRALRSTAVSAPVRCRRAGSATPRTVSIVAALAAGMAAGSASSSRHLAGDADRQPEARRAAGRARRPGRRRRRRSAGLDRGRVGERRIGRVALEVEVLQRHLHAALAVGDRVVHLLHERRLAAAQPLDDDELPQRAGPLERVERRSGWRGRAAGASIAGLGSAMRRTWWSMSKSGSSTHDRRRQVDRRRLDPPAEPGHVRRTARSIRRPQAVEVGRAIEDRHGRRTSTTGAGPSRGATSAPRRRSSCVRRRHVTHASIRTCDRRLRGRWRLGPDWSHGDQDPDRQLTGQRGMRRVLELVEDRPLDLVEHPLDGRRGQRRRRRPGSSSRRTNTAASSTTNVGTPHTSWDSTYAVCSFSTVASGRPVSTSAHTASTSTPAATSTGARARRARCSWPAAAWRCSNSAWWTSRKRSGWVSRTAIDACRASRPVSSSGRSQHRRLTLVDVGLAERERQERDVPVGAGAQPGDDVVVDDAGVRAAVVVGQSEGAGHGRVNDSARQRIPVAAQDAPCGEAEHRPRRPCRPTTSEAWWMRT